jgi:hypothetical protein
MACDRFRMAECPMAKHPARLGHIEPDLQAPSPGLAIFCLPQAELMYDYNSGRAIIGQFKGRSKDA